MIMAGLEQVRLGGRLMGNLLKYLLKYKYKSRLIRIYHTRHKGKIVATSYHLLENGFKKRKIKVTHCHPDLNP